MISTDKGLDALFPPSSAPVACDGVNDAITPCLSQIEGAAHVRLLDEGDGFKNVRHRVGPAGGWVSKIWGRKGVY